MNLVLPCVLALACCPIVRAAENSGPEGQPQRLTGLLSASAPVLSSDVVATQCGQSEIGSTFKPNVCLDAETELQQSSTAVKTLTGVHVSMPFKRRTTQPAPSSARGGKLYSVGAHSIDSSQMDTHGAPDEQNSGTCTSSVPQMTQANATKITSNWHARHAASDETQRKYKANVQSLQNRTDNEHIVTVRQNALALSLRSFAGLEINLAGFISAHAAFCSMHSLLGILKAHFGFEALANAAFSLSPRHQTQLILWIAMNYSGDWVQTLHIPADNPASRIFDALSGSWLLEAIDIPHFVKVHAALDANDVRSMRYIGARLSASAVIELATYALEQTVTGILADTLANTVSADRFVEILVAEGQLSKPLKLVLYALVNTQFAIKYFAAARQVYRDDVALFFSYHLPASQTHFLSIDCMNLGSITSLQALRTCQVAELSGNAALVHCLRLNHIEESEAAFEAFVRYATTMPASAIGEVVNAAALLLNANMLLNPRIVYHFNASALLCAILDAIDMPAFGTEAICSLKEVASMLRSFYVING